MIKCLTIQIELEFGIDVFFFITAYNLSVLKLHTCTVEPRFNEPLYNENLDITNSILCPSNSKIYEKEPRYNEPSI